MSVGKYQRVLTKKLTFRYFYLPRIRNKYYNKHKLTKLEKLLLVLTSEKNGDYPDLLEENSMLKEIQEEMYYAAQDDDVIVEYDAEYETLFEIESSKREEYAKGEKQGLEKGIEKGLKQGLEKGREEEKYRNAKSFIKNGAPLDLISKSLGFSIEELEKMKEE